MRPFRFTSFAPALLFALPLSLEAQVIDLTINNVGIAIGDKPRVNGLRINFHNFDESLDRLVRLLVQEKVEPFEIRQRQRTRFGQELFDVDARNFTESAQVPP